MLLMNRFSKTYLSIGIDSSGIDSCEMNYCLDVMAVEDMSTDDACELLYILDIARDSIITQRHRLDGNDLSPQQPKENT